MTETFVQIIDLARETFNIIRELHSILIQQRGNIVIGFVMFLLPVMLAIHQHLITKLCLYI